MYFSFWITAFRQAINASFFYLLLFAKAVMYSVGVVPRQNSCIFCLLGLCLIPLRMRSDWYVKFRICSLILEWNFERQARP